ncbi:MAG: hypothetical protein GX352_03550 [Clostridiales bacterium]|nr:hypothetical protein [Clostridiales bacterium]
MERFALIMGENSEQRYINSHPFLKHLPHRWAGALIPRVKTRFTETIYRGDGLEELGYILDAPGFFMPGDKLTELNSIKIMENIIASLKKKGISILAFPRWHGILSADHRFLLDKHHIALLDGELIRLASLMETVDRLLAIIKAKPNEIKIGIWGADKPVGRIWAEYLAPHSNNLTLGGHRVRDMVKTGDDILYNTGLSCEITTDPGLCLIEKAIIILCSAPEEWDGIECNQITILSYRLDYGESAERFGDCKGIVIESGMPAIPKPLQISNTLCPWGQLGVLEANLYIMEKRYHDILTEPFPLEDRIKMTREILGQLGSIPMGMVSNNRILTYNGFRRLYFKLP